MKQSDSRECPNCHNFDYMDLTIQETRAAVEHQRAIDTNMTCIDCPQGIAHRLPEGYLQDYKRVVDELGMEQPQKDAMINFDGIRSYLNPQENSGG
jgi:cytochrome c-type protein NapC